MASQTASTSAPTDAQSEMKLASHIARSAAVTAGASGMRLVYSTRPHWPFAPASSAPDGTAPASIDIAVLDSSFNPPSRAHLALLLSEPILARPKRSYDGHLLLFSTQNADKGAGKPGDASLEQRVEMMTLMARDVERIQSAAGRTANVAVGLVDKPLIFAKSTLTRELLRQHQPDRDMAPTRLHWVVGFDTLYRVFQPKYYESLHQMHEQCQRFFDHERTTFVCARRDPASYPQLASKDAEGEARSEEDKLLASSDVAKWVEQQSIGMLDLESDQAKLSSTSIRTLLKDTSINDADKKRRLAQLVPPALVEYLVESRIYQDHQP